MAAACVLARPLCLFARPDRIRARSVSARFSKTAFCTKLSAGECGSLRASNFWLDRKGVIWPRTGRSQARCQSFSCIRAMAARADEKVAPPLLRSLLSALMEPYLRKNPTAARALDVLRQHEQGPLRYDHFAFRTFGVDGCGIDSLAKVFEDLGYKQMDELRFPAKKLRAFWYAPPDWDSPDLGKDGCEGALPRVFISELLVDQLSAESQKVIRRYTREAARLAPHAAASALLGALPWRTPALADYLQLAKESEYAAWTLVNGYALNHTTVSVHSLHRFANLQELNAFLEEKTFRLNSEGSVIKVSPDGGLRQSSTVADTGAFTFSGGEGVDIPRSYIEFAERLVLPKFQHLPADQVQEHHRREGFEVGNADKIFESTSSGQIGAKAVT